MGRLIGDDVPLDMPTLIEQTARVIGETTVRKNAIYGDSVQRVEQALLSLAPNGIATEQYGDLLLLTRILDKCCRIANRVTDEDENPYADIAGYAIMGIVAEARERMER